MQKEKALKRNLRVSLLSKGQLLGTEEIFLTYNALCVGTNEKERIQKVMEKAELTKTEKDRAKFEKQQEIQNLLQNIAMYRVFSLKV